jgi:hypothetical protein
MYKGNKLVASEYVMPRFSETSEKPVCKNKAFENVWTAILNAIVGWRLKEMPERESVKMWTPRHVIVHPHIRKSSLL